MFVRIAAAVLFTAIAAPALAAEWSYEDGSGQTVTLDHIPQRIVAHAHAAAGLIPFGIRPVGIYVDGPVEDDKALQGLDLTGIEIVGEAWGEINVEKAAALRPDLIVAEWWPMDSTWGGFERGADSSSQPIMNLAPITGPAQRDSVVTLIEDYSALAESLGADLADPAIAADKSAFDASLAAFKSVVAAKPGLVAMPVWAGTDALYVAATGGSAELSDFASWGLHLIDPETADDRGYWETLSWENADKYQPDLILVDNRSAATMQTALDQPTWTAMKAAAAGQVTDWPAFWLRNYRAYATALDTLTAAIAAADENLTD
ncbi:ABC transporter substrate-binding protein [Devosia sp.]|uniref:ABC transporter substrate-binding protein n=1 Tax=Devosia sp. TaxID=1871048 RepID=UPI003A944AEA